MAILPPIPGQACHRFHGKAATPECIDATDDLRILPLFSPGTGAGSDGSKQEGNAESDADPPKDGQKCRKSVGNKKRASR